MKKTLYIIASLSVFMLAACTSHSGASNEQIQKAHDQAKEMLRQTHEQQAAAPADTIRK